VLAETGARTNTSNFILGNIWGNNNAPANGRDDIGCAFFSS
jgi:hypothetical protein